MDKKTTIKLRKCLSGYDLKFVKQLRQFLKLTERNGIPIEDIYKYADEVHRISMSVLDERMKFVEHEQEVMMDAIMPKCPKCGHRLDLIPISDTGDKIPNNVYGYKYMYYCDDCLYEEFKSDRTFQEEFERLQKLAEEKK